MKYRKGCGHFGLTQAQEFLQVREKLLLLELAKESMDDPSHRQDLRGRLTSVRYLIQFISNQLPKTKEGNSSSYEEYE